MLTIRKLVMQFLTHPGINKSYVAGEFYGKRGKVPSAMLRNKIIQADGRDFTDEEIERLYKIRQEFLAGLL